MTTSLSHKTEGMPPETDVANEMVVTRGIWGILVIPGTLGFPVILAWLVQVEDQSLGMPAVMLLRLQSKPRIPSRLLGKSQISSSPCCLRLVLIYLSRSLPLILVPLVSLMFHVISFHKINQHVLHSFSAVHWKKKKKLLNDVNAEMEKTPHTYTKEKEMRKQEGAKQTAKLYTR